MLVQVERGQRGLLYERLFDIAAALDVSIVELFKVSSSPTERGRAGGR
jgi:transcriptional regulator with XRE-family HTH domain